MRFIHEGGPEDGNVEYCESLPKTIKCDNWTGSYKLTTEHAQGLPVLKWFPHKAVPVGTPVKRAIP